MSGETHEEARKRGMKEGRTDAEIAEHGARLDKINGSIERTADDLEALAEEIRKRAREGQRSLDDLERTLRSLLRDLSSEIRTLKEEQRIRDERVTVSAETLATETERRREELAVGVAGSDRESHNEAMSFTKRQQLAGLAIAIAGLIVALVLASPWN